MKYEEKTIAIPDAIPKEMRSMRIPPSIMDTRQLSTLLELIIRHAEVMLLTDHVFYQYASLVLEEAMRMTYGQDGVDYFKEHQMKFKERVREGEAILHATSILKESLPDYDYWENTELLPTKEE